MLGLAILPAFRALPGGDERAWTFPALFLGMLVALRVVPAILRHVLPLSSEAKTVGAERRQIAKQYDCYQWQKLFWIGLGMLSYAAISGGLSGSVLIVTLICLAGGGAGMLLWWKTRGSVKIATQAG
jgi:hypothetical protein